MASSPCRALPRGSLRGQPRCRPGVTSVLAGVSGGSGRSPPPPRSRAEPPRPAAPGRLGQGAGPGKRGRKMCPPRVSVSQLIFAPVAVGSATFAEPRRREAAPRCSAERSGAPRARREAGSVRALPRRAGDRSRGTATCYKFISIIHI